MKANMPPSAITKLEAWLSVIVIAVLTPLAALWLGCSRAPVAPDLTPGSFTLPSGVVVGSGTLLNETEPADPAMLDIKRQAGQAGATAESSFGPFSQKLGPAGGQMSFEYGDGLTQRTGYFVVAEGVLDSDVTITVWVTTGANGEGDPVTLFRFEPHGQSFSVPAQLVLESSLPAGAIQYNYWYSSLTGSWLAAASAVSADGYVNFPIAHFSQYGTVERISVGGQ